MISPLNAKLDRKWIEASAEITELRNTIAQQSELLAAHKAEMQDWQRELLSTQQERDRLLRGEFICHRCGIRKDSERSTDHEF